VHVEDYRFLHSGLEVEIRRKREWRTILVPYDMLRRVYCKKFGKATEREVISQMRTELSIDDNRRLIVGAIKKSL